MGEMICPHPASPSRSVTSATKSSTGREEPWPFYLDSPASSEGSQDSHYGVFSPPAVVANVAPNNDDSRDHGNCGDEAQLGTNQGMDQSDVQGSNLQEDNEAIRDMDAQAMAPAFKAPRAP